MNRVRFGIPAMFATVLLLHPFARAADFPCPPPSEQKDFDVRGDFDGKAQTLMKIATADVQGTAQRTVVDLFSKYPHADRVAIINTLLSVTCNLIKASTQMSDIDKLHQWWAVYPAVRSLMPAGQKSDSDDVSEKQNAFLSRFRDTTTFSSIVQVFGEPEEQLVLPGKYLPNDRTDKIEGKTFTFYRFQTVSDSTGLYILTTASQNVVAVAISALDANINVATIPLLEEAHLKPGKTEEDATDEDYIVDDMNTLTLRDLAGLCSTEESNDNDIIIDGKPDARYRYFVIGPCYFGNSGNFHYFFFGFSQTDFFGKETENERALDRCINSSNFFSDDPVKIDEHLRLICPKAAIEALNAGLVDKCPDASARFFEHPVTGNLLRDCPEAANAHPILAFIPLSQSAKDLYAERVTFARMPRRILSWIFWRDPGIVRREGR
jgi:hypothetical protein